MHDPAADEATDAADGRAPVRGDDWLAREDRFRLLADAAPIGIFVAAPDGTSLYVNRQGEINTGRTHDEIRGLGWQEFIHPDDVPLVAREQQRSIEDGDGFVAEYRIVRPDGSIVWVRSRGGRMLDEHGAVDVVIGTVADITEVHEAGERLRESEERTRAIIESAAEGIVSVDEAGTLLEFNAAAERIFGYDSSEVVGRRRFADLLPAAPSLDDLVGRDRRELTGRHRLGQDLPLEVVVTEVMTSEGRIRTALIRDLSAHKAFAAEIERRTTHDELTGLPNRLLFDAQLDIALARARPRSSSVGVLCVLIDRLSLVTESLGHAAADALLLDAARRINRASDPAPAPARLAHDQFVVLLEDLADVADAVRVAEAIIRSVDQPYLLADGEALARACVGIAVSPLGAGHPSQLLADAGVAMRRAAESIEGYEIFEGEMRTQADALHEREIALRHGIERDEFELYYQPVVDLRSGAVVSAEALIRWHRPDVGVVLPSSFIPLAEETGLVIELGDWVINRACEQVAVWQHDPAVDCPPVSINLSARQLSHPDLIETVRRSIHATGVDPSRLAFEITETVLLRDVDRAVATLEALHDLGVRLSLDDFGTGYSSLTYLCQFPIDIVKIDRSFVSEGEDINAPIVSMILGLAETLGLDVIAEGVETLGQADSLRVVGCTMAQGFLFARPAPSTDVTHYLSAGQ